MNVKAGGKLALAANDEAYTCGPLDLYGCVWY